MLAVRGLQKAYADATALDGVDLDAAAGTILGLLGPNGAGKTTLGSISAGFRRPDAGSVRVGDIDVLRTPDRAQQLSGLRPQHTGLQFPLTVRAKFPCFS